MTPPLPKERRALDECELTHGGKVLRLNGQVYLLDMVRGGVLLTKGDGECYSVSADACTCPDHQYRKKTFVCKHRTALQQLGLLPGGVEPRESRPAD